MQKKIREELFKFNIPRRVVQFLSFIFFSAIMLNLSSLPVLFPVLWTWGLSPNIVGDALTALQFTLYDAVFPWLAVASFLVVGILIGKSMCGWICPFGLIQDLVGFIKRKKMEISPRTHNSMLYVKYLILAITIFISLTFAASKIAKVSRSYETALGIFVKAPFTTLSPGETLFASLPKMIQDFRITISANPSWDVLLGISNVPILFWVQFSILIAVLVFAAYVPRSWCKYLCPHGAIMALMNKFSFLGLRRDLAKCTKGDCRLCVEVCPMRVRILELPWEKFSDPECIYCMKCADACPDKAIRLKYP